jgi:hypothetical protein
MFLNNGASDFYGFKVNEYSFDFSMIAAILGLNLFIILAVSVTVTFYSRKISPRDAMLRN